MRDRLIMFMKTHPAIIMKLWAIGRSLMYMWSKFVSVQKKTILFCSLGGRNFSDSPRAIYEEICKRKEFDDWKIIWAFVNPDCINIPRGEKVKVDSIPFFKALLYSRVLVGNSGIDRGLGLKLKGHVRVETWHGAPFKKIGGEEHTATFAVKPAKYKGELDNDTIRCAQSSYDRDIYARVFHATKDSFLMCDLPRNDELFTYSNSKIEEIKRSLKIDCSKKVILYTPTYREYLINDHHQTYMAPPIDLSKWEKTLGREFVLLIRTHYAVAAALAIKDNNFVKNVSDYSSLNDLYAISDMMISDYSSTFLDFSILKRPMFCFAYDLSEYEEKRGLYIDLAAELPCSIDLNEDDLLKHIQEVDINDASKKTATFNAKYAPYAGHASEAVVDKILTRL